MNRSIFILFLLILMTCAYTKYYNTKSINFAIDDYDKWKEKVVFDSNTGYAINLWRDSCNRGISIVSSFVKDTSLNDSLIKAKVLKRFPTDTDFKFKDTTSELGFKAYKLEFNRIEEKAVKMEVISYSFLRNGFINTIILYTRLEPIPPFLSSCPFSRSD